MPTTPADQRSHRETHVQDLCREQTGREALGSCFHTGEARLPPCPAWIPKKAWKRLFYANGSRLFVEEWQGKATVSGVRIICNRAICCGFDKVDCRQLVGEWLRTKDPTTKWIILEFDAQYDIAVHYLESRGVLHRQRERDRQDFWKVASSTANRILVLLADNPGAKREALQNELGLTRDNLKKHLARLQALQYTGRVGWGLYKLTPKGEEHVASLLAYAKTEA